MIREISTSDKLSHIDFVSCCPTLEGRGDRAYAALGVGGLNLSNKEYIVTIELYIPETSGAKGVSLLFSQICSCLSGVKEKYDIRSITLNRMELDQQNRRYILNGEIKLRIISPKINVVRYDDMMVKRII